MDIFTQAIPAFSKHRLAKAHLRWTRTHPVADLAAEEQQHAGGSCFTT